MFAPDTSALRIFTAVLGDRKLWFDTETYRVEVDPPMGAKAAAGLGGELLDSLQPILINAFWGAVQRKGKSHTKLWVCSSCDNLRLATKQRSTVICPLCGEKAKQKEVVLPWRDANRHNRPKYPEVAR